MNFFERQADVRRLSRRLVAYFIIAVLGVVVAVNLVLLLVFQSSLASTSDVVALLAVGTVGTVGLIGGASLVHISALRSGGGGKVAQQLGGTPVPPSTSDPQLRRLRNVVEEIAIASSVPVPEIYVLEGEQGINAFAAGHSPSDAAIAVTTGTLERLNRRELEGVIAHEFSHIANGDMRLNMRLMGALFGITVLAIVGRVLLRGGVYSGAGRRRGGGKNDGAAMIMIVGLGAMVIGFIGLAMGRLIKAAVARQREYLADASAVQFTRQTEGLTGALKKIGGISDGSALEHGKVDEVSHMLFGEGLKMSSMMATHPPITKRIQALDPSFDPEQLDTLARTWEASPPSGLAEDQALGFTGPGEALPPVDTHVDAQPQAVAASTAAPTETTYREAEAILAALPQDLRDRAHHPTTALPLVLGLLLAVDPATRTYQHEILVEHLGQDVADNAWNEGAALSELHAVLRLPLAEIAFPALRQRDEAQLNAVMTAVHALVWADGQLTPHEYCLSRLLYRDLNEAVGHHEPTGSPRHTLAQSPTETATLLAVLATAGHPNLDASRQAYDAGMTTLQLPGASLPYRPPAEGVLSLEPVWAVLDHVSWPERGRLVEALVVVASHDGVVTLGEWELLRLVCAMLHCPLPPQLSSVTAPA